LILPLCAVPRRKWRYAGGLCQEKWQKRDFLGEHQVISIGEYRQTDTKHKKRSEKSGKRGKRLRGDPLANGRQLFATVQRRKKRGENQGKKSGKKAGTPG